MDKSLHYSDDQENFCRSVEECIDVPEQGADDFRRMIAAYSGHLQYNGKSMTWESHPQLKEAICKLLENDPDADPLIGPY